MRTPGGDPVNEGDPSGLIGAGTICGEDGSQSGQCRFAENESAATLEIHDSSEACACPRSYSSKGSRRV